jgi:hypothetical protein
MLAVPLSTELFDRQVRPSVQQKYDLDHRVYPSGRAKELALLDGTGSCHTVDQAAICAALRNGQLSPGCKPLGDIVNDTTLV